jgi:hypothetical protein
VWTTNESDVNPLRRKAIFDNAGIPAVGWVWDTLLGWILIEERSNFVQQDRHLRPSYRTRDLRRHLAFLGLNVDSRELRRVCTGHGISRDMRGCPSAHHAANLETQCRFKIDLSGDAARKSQRVKDASGPAERTESTLFSHAA